MSYILRSPFLLIVTLFVAHIHAAILFEYNSTSTNLNVSSNVAARPICYDTEKTALHPFTLDCLQAQDSVPSEAMIGLFHRQGDADTFQLPVLASYGTCTIVIRLENTIPDISSWATISQAARTLILTCSIGRPPQAKTGGYTHVGMKQQIRISLLKIPPGDPGLDNITNITASASTS